MIVGVADDAKAAEKLNELYGVDAIVYQRFRITGVDHEAKQLPKGLDGYFLAITQRIASSPISPVVQGSDCPRRAPDKLLRQVLGCTSCRCGIGAVRLQWWVF